MTNLCECEVDSVMTNLCECEIDSVMTNLCECEVDSVREWGDDKATIQTHVLVAVAKLSRTLSHQKLIGLLLPVKAQLALPLKLTCVHDATKHQRSSTHITEVKMLPVNILTQSTYIWYKGHHSIWDRCPHHIWVNILTGKKLKCFFFEYSI